MIFEKNLKKLRFRTKLAKNFEIMSILVNFSKIFDFSPNLQQRIFFFKFEKCRFYSNFWKFSILVKIYEYGYFFFENFKKFRFKWNFRKKIGFGLNFREKFGFGSNFLKKFRFCFQKFRFLSKLTKNLISFENFEKCRLRPHFPKKIRFWLNFRKISILVKSFEKISISVKIFEKFRLFSKISKNVDFCQIFGFFREFRKISILVIIFEKFWFWWNFRKNSSLVKFFVKISNLVEIFEKNFDSLRNFRKISILVKFLTSAKNLDFSQIFEKFRIPSNFRKISIWVIIFEKLWFW